MLLARMSVIFSMNKNTSYRYDAYISYAHENKASARWLATILRNYWVPFRKRRKIFFDQARPTAGNLHEQITKALCQSRFLVVCASDDATNSSRVNEEIRIFRRYHNSENVLFCRIGDIADDMLPDEISDEYAKYQQAESSLTSTTYSDQKVVPDLRGDPANAIGEVRNKYKEILLPLLARIMGFSDQREFTDTTKRKRYQMAYGIVALLTIMVMVIGIWSYWLTTPNRMHHSAIQDAVELAETENRGSHIIPLARLVATTGGRAAIERLAASHNDTYKPLVLAVGYAMLDPPFCNEVAYQFARLKLADDETYLFRDGALIAARVCSELDIQIARPQFDHEDDRAQAQWALHLARSGWWAEARKVLLNGNIPNSWKLDILIELQLSGDVVSSAEIEAVLQAWMAEMKPDELIWDLWGLVKPLATLDFAGELQSPVAQTILPIIIDTFILYNEQQIRMENTWDRIQQVAAHAAGAGYLQATEALLVLAPEPSSTDHWSTGWAWRGLALDRLGRAEDATEAFRKAKLVELQTLQETVGHKQWQTMLETLALADRWREVFRAADKPNDQSARLDLKIRALELWYQRKSLHNSLQ